GHNPPSLRHRSPQPHSIGPITEGGLRRTGTLLSVEGRVLLAAQPVHLAVVLLAERLEQVGIHQARLEAGQDGVLEDTPRTWRTPRRDSAAAAMPRTAGRRRRRAGYCAPWPPGAPSPAPTAPGG